MSTVFATFTAVATPVGVGAAVVPAGPVQNQAFMIGSK